MNSLNQYDLEESDSTSNGLTVTSDSTSSDSTFGKMPDYDFIPNFAQKRPDVVYTFNENHNSRINFDVNRVSRNMFNDSISPLQRAVENEDHWKLGFLLRMGANPHIGKKIGKLNITPLMTAVKKKDHKSVNILLKFKACPNDILTVSKNGFKVSEYALHYAVLNNDYVSAKYLIDHGAYVKANSIISKQDKNYNGPTALYHAVGNGNWKMINLLMRNGADPYSKFFDYNIVEEVSSSKGDKSFDYNISSETSPIRRAELNDDDDVISMLISS